MLNRSMLSLFLDFYFAKKESGKRSVVVFVHVGHQCYFHKRFVCGLAFLVCMCSFLLFFFFWGGGVTIGSTEALPILCVSDFCE